MAPAQLLLQKVDVDAAFGVRRQHHREKKKTIDDQPVIENIAPNTKSTTSTVTNTVIPSSSSASSQYHPLLRLHQSVVEAGTESGNNITRNSSSRNYGTDTIAGGSSKMTTRQQTKQPTTMQQQQQRDSDGPSNLTTANNINESATTGQHRHGISATTNDGVNTLTTHRRNSHNMRRPSMLTVISRAMSTLTKIIVILTILLLLLIVLMNLLSIDNNYNSNATITQIMTTGSSHTRKTMDVSSILSLTRTIILNFTRELKSIPFFNKFMKMKEDESMMVVSTEHYERRLALGFDLLRHHDDASGSCATCESVLRAIVNDYKFRGSSSSNNDLTSLALSLPAMSFNTNNHEGGLISRALLCIGESNLALSTRSHGSKSIRMVQLTRAMESLEAATAIEPTNPSIRCGLGLTYLLVGMMRYDTDDDDDSKHNNEDNSMRFIFQSIDHLTAAVGLTNEYDFSKYADDNDDEVMIAIRIAAMHNLGLAYIALDGKTSSESYVGTKTTHFIDWVKSLHSLNDDDDNVMMKKSWVLSSNVGAMHMQLGMIEDATSSLHSILDKYCDGVLSSNRHEEVCSIVRQNLVVAKSYLEGESTMKNAAQSEALLPSEDVFLLSDDPNQPIDESTPVAFEESISSGLDLSSKVDVIEKVFTPWGSNPVRSDMQSALVALEKAAMTGTQRTRLLLALARARSSAGDLSGAVDASLKAIDVATSEEERESSTTYLESLMEKLAGKNLIEGEVLGIIDEEIQEMSDKKSIHRDIAFLEMKLEVERLKYKVLEQEMRLRSLPESGDDIVRVFSQKRGITNTNNAIERVSVDEIKQNVVTSQNITKIVVKEDIQEVPIAGIVEIEDVSDELIRESESTTTSVNRTIDTITTTNVNPTEDANVTTDEESTTETGRAPDAIVDSETNSADGLYSKLELPPLFSPELNPPITISGTALSYIKIADAYLDKGQYALASKQFKKVIKKAPDHLPAYLGYATALEREGKVKQINAAALAYGEASALAVIQGNKVDSIVKAGSGGIAESILRRAVALTKSGDPGERVETLLKLVEHAHTNSLAADIYFEIGIELSKQKGIDPRRIVQSFATSNEYMIQRKDSDVPFHIRSIIELGKIMLLEDNFIGVIDLLDKVKNMKQDDDVQTELLVLSGRAHAKLGQIEAALSEFNKAVTLPLCSTTALAHHELALTLQKSNGDGQEINKHFEAALDKGMEPTSEAIESLGERNMHVMRALNRQYYNSVNNGGDASERSGGGIMSGGGLGQQSSVFAPKAKENEESPQSDTLTLLEQGAAAYDGNSSPMGGEVEGTESSLSNLKKKKQQGSESNLHQLKR